LTEGPRDFVNILVFRTFELFPVSTLCVSSLNLVGDLVFPVVDIAENGFEAIDFCGEGVVAPLTFPLTLGVH
jgi:hypothetical protein